MTGAPRLIYGSLFSGIGGIDLGFDRAGLTCMFQVEIDDYCRRVLAKHWPDVVRYGDIRDVDRHNLPTVDVLAGGFPCQPHSHAGERRGSADDRDLWGEFARIIRELRPRWVLAENVSGLLSSEDGRFFGRVLRDLATLGYDAEWQSLRASSFGAPHQRERVFIVAYPASERCPAFEVLGPLDPEGIAASASFWWSERRPDNKHRDLWPTPDGSLVRMVDGISERMDAVRGLGNAVVPVITEHIGRRLLRAWQPPAPVVPAGTEGDTSCNE